MNKVMLIQPSSIMPLGSIKRLPTPMGLLYLGNALLKEDLEVKILDSPCQGFENERVDRDKVFYGLSDEAVKKAIASYSPDVVGVTSLFSSQMGNAFHHCDLVKSVTSAPVVLGGIAPSLNPLEALANNSVDFVVIGEGEKRFVKLIKAIEKRREPNFDGVAFKRKKELVINPRTSRLEDIDEQYPARGLIDMEKYIEVGLPISPFTRRERAEQLMTSRGCVFDCIFCPSVQFWEHKIKTRGVGNVMAEIEGLVDNYGVQELQFFDDNLTFNKDRAKELFRRLKDYNLSWCTPNGLMAQTIDDEMINLMAKSGAYQISLAIESGNDRVREQIIHKKVPSKERIKAIVRACHERGIQAHGFFVIGFPGEKREEIDETLRYPYDANFDSVSIYTASPMFGSRLYDYCYKKGYLTDGARGDIKKGEIRIPRSDRDYVMEAEELSQMVDDATRKFNETSRARNPRAWDEKFAMFLKKHPEYSHLILGRAT